MRPPPPPPPITCYVSRDLQPFVVPECSFRIHNTPTSPTPILSHINPVHKLLSYLFLIHFNILLPPIPTLSTRSPLSRIPTDISPSRLVPPMHAAYPLPFRLQQYSKEVQNTKIPQHPCSSVSFISLSTS